MANLTAKELSALEDQLNMEQVLVRKYQTMAEQVNEMDLKNQFKSISSRHQQHYNTLLGFLQ
ncbi:MAG: spore coat protein [Oscillospiraceae bacterium]|nr:spore coat protein [Oscillospiraceae bacterium]